MLAARHLYSFKALAARKTYLITARARKNKRTARMLASARKDHSIPLVFSNIIQRNLVLDRSQLFPSSHVWNDSSSFRRKIYRADGRFLQQNSTFDHLYPLKTKSKKIIPNVAR